MRSLVSQVVPVVVMLSALTSQAQPAKDDEWTSLLPPGEGRELVVNSCTSCHNLKIVVVARKSSEDWAKSLGDMIERGAEVFPEEMKPLTSYLSNSFGTDVPPLLNVNAATRADLEKLPSLKPEIITRILEVRSKSGPFKDAEQFRQALGMDKPTSSKIMFLFKYSDE
jgi:DNA uptake protein ComE-like DNA-binding protein